MTRAFRERVEARGKLFLAGLAVASTLLSLAIGVSAAGISVNDWWEKNVDWRDQEYEKLRSLHAGYTRAKFESVLGEPVFDRPAANGKFREQTFRRREYWVQTISNEGGSVVLYAVTACDHEFQPTFPVTGGRRSGAQDVAVTLNSSKFSEIAPDHALLDYEGTAATSNSRFYEIQSSGNPSNYKTFVWGINDVCPDFFNEVYPAIYERSGIRPESHRTPTYTGDLAKAPPWVGRVRTSLSVNTYAETAPLFDLRRLPEAFQVGADRILTRTTGD